MKPAAWSTRIPQEWCSGDSRQGLIVINQLNRPSQERGACKRDAPRWSSVSVLQSLRRPGELPTQAPGLAGHRRSPPGQTCEEQHPQWCLPRQRRLP